MAEGVGGDAAGGPRTNRLGYALGDNILPGACSYWLDFLTGTYVVTGEEG